MFGEYTVYCKKGQSLTRHVAETTCTLKDCGIGDFKQWGGVKNNESFCAQVKLK